MEFFCTTVFPMIELIPNERALYIQEIDAIVVADLHIGYEKSLEKRGILVRNNERNMLLKLQKLVDKYSAKNLIIVGDVKHQIGIDRNVKSLERINVNIIVVKGNHDGDIEKILNAEIYDSRGLKLGDYGFIHGHAWPSEEVMKAKYVLMGHIHPEIKLEDSQGNEHRYPCFLIGKLTQKGKEKYNSDAKVIILPAFNPLVGSAMIDDMGPLLKNGIVGEFEVYLLNGTYLGKLEDIRSSTRK